MKDGKAFIGFNEAPIKFPPTFKYDVLKSVKREKTQGHAHRDSRARAIRRWVSPVSNQNLSEVQEAYRSADEREQEGSADMDDAGSFVSAAITAVSSRSRLTSFGDTDDAESARMLARERKISKTKNDRPNASGDATPIRNVFIAASVMKARQKWLSLLKPSSSSTLPTQTHQRLEDKTKATFSSSSPHIMQIDVESPTPVFRDTSSAISLGREQTPNTLELKRTSSKRSTKSNHSANMLSVKATDSASTQQEVKSGVYDSLSKKCVLKQVL